MPPLQTYYEVVISLRPFMGVIPNEVIEEKAKIIAKELNAEYREVAE